MLSMRIRSMSGLLVSPFVGTACCGAGADALRALPDAGRFRGIDVGVVRDSGGACGPPHFTAPPISLGPGSRVTPLQSFLRSGWHTHGPGCDARF